MQITLEIPDELASTLTAPGQDPTRAALEAWGLEAYRQRRLSAYQLRTLLGIPSRWDLDGFLKEHRVETYTVEDCNRISLPFGNSGNSTSLTARHDRRGWRRSSPYLVRIAVAQRMAGHANAKTTGLYDRRSDEISVGEIEKIRI